MNIAEALESRVRSDDSAGRAPCVLEKILGDAGRLPVAVEYRRPVIEVADRLFTALLLMSQIVNCYSYGNWYSLTAGWTCCPRDDEESR
jgi:hypothetical protein